MVKRSIKRNTRSRRSIRARKQSGAGWFGGILNQARNLSRKAGNRIRSGAQNFRRRVGRSTNNKNNKHNNNRRLTKRRNNRNMKGGYAIEYSPLPCDAAGATDWNSTAQVGHETCVDYGTDGAEDDSRFSGKSMDEMSIDETIKEAVDKALAKINPGSLTQKVITVKTDDASARAKAESIAAARLSAAKGS